MYENQDLIDQVLTVTENIQNPLFEFELHSNNYKVPFKIVHNFNFPSQ